MRKLIGIELTKMRYYRVIWATVLFALGDSVAIAFKNQYEAALSRYPMAEYNVFLFATGRMFFILTILSTAYVINEDYSMRTIQNVLSAGVHKVKYFFARLFSQILFIFCLYVLCCAAYIAVRILTRGINPAIAWREFLFVFLIMSLQLTAYVGIANMVSMFCRNQAIAMAAGETILFLTIVGRGYYAAGVSFFRFMAYEPMAILENVSSDYVTVSDLPQYAFSALLILAVTTAIGYVRYMRTEVW